MMHRQDVKKRLGGLFGVILLLSLWCSFTLYNTRNEWQKAIQLLEQNGVILSSMPKMKTDYDMPLLQDGIAASEEAARESQMHLVSIQEETTAVGQYRIELMGSYQNLIYFLNTMSVNYPSCGIHIERIEPEETALYIRMMVMKKMGAQKKNYDAEV